MSQLWREEFLPSQFRRRFLFLLDCPAEGTRHGIRVWVYCFLWLKHEMNGSGRDAFSNRASCICPEGRQRSPQPSALTGSEGRKYLFSCLGCPCLKCFNIYSAIWRKTSYELLELIPGEIGGRITPAAPHTTFISIKIGSTRDTLST